jgi:hypothetical protein
MIGPSGLVLVVSHLFAVSVLWLGLGKSKLLNLDVRDIFATSHTEHQLSARIMWFLSSQMSLQMLSPYMRTERARHAWTWVNVRKIESDRHNGNTLHIVKSQWSSSCFEIEIDSSMKNTCTMTASLGPFFIFASHWKFKICIQLLAFFKLRVVSRSSWPDR